MTITPPHDKYFQGILQLRNPSEELIVFVEETTKKDDRAVFTQIKKVRGGGLDYYITSNKYLQILAKKIVARFSGELKLSSTLHTHRHGDPLYRITILFRLFDVKRGDVVDFQGEDVELLQMKNTKAYVKDVKSGRKFWVEMSAVKSK